MDDVTQQNAALVEQAAAAAESLEEQTQNLAITVAHFKLIDNLHSRSAVVSTPSLRPRPQLSVKETAFSKPKNQPKPIISEEWEEF